ncbi:MAG: hypothetical protein ACLRXY_04240 [Acutalibacteraceae bacterium]
MDFFDLHCDTLTECMDDGDSLLKNERDIDFERGSIFGRWNQVFAVFVPDSMDDSLVEGYFDSACNFYFDELKRKATFSRYSLPRTCADIRAESCSRWRARAESAALSASKSSMSADCGS